MRTVRSMASALLLSTTTLLSGTYATDAHAATTYLVQLGSYETDKQALDQWSKVNKRFPNLFGSLQYIPKTVKMPPDNITYHRTQAGPLKSRGDAESICDDMQVSGYECYVVETALSASETKASQAALPAAAETKLSETKLPETKISDAKAPAAEKPVEKAVAAKVEEKSKPEATVAATPVAPTTDSKLKSIIESAKAKVATLPNTAPVAATTTAAVEAKKELEKPAAKVAEKTNETAESLKKALKESPKKEEAKVIAEDKPLPKAVKAAEDPEIEAMFTQATKDEEAALPSLAKKETTASLEKVTPVAPLELKDDVMRTPTETVSFLDSLNKKVDAGASARTASTPEREAVSIDTQVKKAEKPVIAEQEVKTEATKPTVEPTVSAAPTTSPFQFGESKYAGSKVVTSPDAPLPWLTTSNKKMDDVKTAPLSIQPTPMPATLASQEAEPAQRVENPTDAKVEVAEAIRVPLSTVSQPEIRPTYNTTPDFERFGSPSQPIAKSNLWAEIGYFPNQNAALGYWQTLHERAKDLPEGLRVRITKPFMSYHSAEQMSLRVGPFSSSDAIRALCKATQAEQLHCKSIKEFGDSTEVSTSKQKRFDSAGRYYQRKHQLESKWKPLGLGSSNAYYVQLGSYTNPMTAQNEWESIKASHSDALAGVSEQIISPRFSSASSDRYRLRAGPFGSNVSAVNACEELRRDGVLCVVVSGN